MRQRLRSHLTLANLMVTLVALIGLVVLVAGASGSSDARGGSYKGKTDQDMSVSFKVKHDKVKNPEVAINFGYGCVGTINISGSDKINDAGKFKITEGNASFGGKFVSKSKVKGNASGEKANCGSKTVSYKAHHQ